VMGRGEKNSRGEQGGRTSWQSGLWDLFGPLFLKVTALGLILES